MRPTRMSFEDMGFYSRDTVILSRIASLTFVLVLQSGCMAACELRGYWTYQTFGFQRSLASYLRYDVHHLWIAVGAAPVTVLFAFLASRLARRDRREDQERRDRLAARIVSEIERRVEAGASISDLPKFALYLRPFRAERSFTTWRTGIANSKHQFIDSGSVAFDYSLLDFFDRMDIHLLSIGARKSDEGAGRIEASDSEWRARFRLLAERANVILVVPGLQPGILSEIRWLRAAGLLSRTILFKPSGYTRGGWLAVARGFEEQEDIELPVYSSHQISFRMYPSGICHDVRTWTGSGTAERSSQNLLRALLSDTPERDR
jgi:hypothetical protein